YAAVALEIVDRDTQELVRYNHVPVVDGEFRMAVKLDQPGRYEVRVLGLQPDMLVQRPEPLGVFMLTVEGNRRRPAETSGPVF
ncbi:MAG TPA: hypothetical protein VEI97_08655, partial [bacterium]|nr:hypothetical protein [bacterium]